MYLTDATASDLCQVAYLETRADVDANGGNMVELERQYISGEWEAFFDVTVMDAETVDDLPPAFQRAFEHLTEETTHIALMDARDINGNITRSAHLYLLPFAGEDVEHNDIVTALAAFEADSIARQPATVKAEVSDYSIT